LFDSLVEIVNSKRRSVHALEQAPLLPGATFFSDPVPCDARPFTRRPAERGKWFTAMKERFGGTDLVFLDPDNGIAPESLRMTRRSAGKSVLPTEIASLQRPCRAIDYDPDSSKDSGRFYIDLSQTLASRF
jgi:hypothetical protein